MSVCTIDNVVKSPFSLKNVEIYWSAKLNASFKTVIITAFLDMYLVPSLTYTKTLIQKINH